LHFAVKGENSEILSLILDHTIDVDSQASHGQTPLWLAALRGNEAAVELLLQRKANPNIQDHEGSRTALHVAVARNVVKNVKSIIECGLVDLEIQDKSHHTALQLAGEMKRKEIFELLLSQGANSDFEGDSGDFWLNKLEPEFRVLMRQYRHRNERFVRIAAQKFSELEHRIQNLQQEKGELERRVVALEAQLGSPASSRKRKLSKNSN
jgi:uncharacterized protein YdcH (DUF465 family)